MYLWVQLRYSFFVLQDEEKKIMCYTASTVRRWLGKRLLCWMLVCVVFLCAQPVQAAGNAERLYRGQFLRLINAERTKENLSPLAVGTEELNKAAMARAKELTLRYSYLRPDGRREFSILPEYGVEDPSIGETYWAGTDSPEEAVAAWMNNEYFRSCILDGNAQNIGVGYYQGGEYGCYWVVIFTYPQGSMEEHFAQEALQLVNQERTARGLEALEQGDAGLTAATALRAREIASVDSHTRPDGSSCFTVLEQFGVTEEAVGENIAWGISSPEEVVNSWMCSADHRAILLDADAGRMCVCCYYNADSAYGTNWAMLLTE